MKAGPRDRKILIQRASVVTDDHGGEDLAWTDYATEWAQVLFGTGRERREAAQVASSVSATFRVLHNALTSSVTPRDRISFDGGLWDVQSNVPLGLNDGREITAVRST